MFIEVCVLFRGRSYTVIYGEYIDGTYFSLPSFGKCCNACHLDDVSHNVSNLVGCGFDEDTATVIAKAVRDSFCNHA